MDAEVRRIYDNAQDITRTLYDLGQDPDRPEVAVSVLRRECFFDSPNAVSTQAPVPG